MCYGVVAKASPTQQDEVWPCQSTNLPVTNESRYDHFFSCRICLKLRPQSAFTDKQLKDRRAKGRSQSDRRFCLDCGCRNKMHQPGQILTVDGRSEALCAECRERCRYGRYCRYCRMCEPCVSKISSPPITLTLSPSEREELRCPLCAHQNFVVRLGNPPREFQK